MRPALVVALHHNVAFFIPFNIAKAVMLVKKTQVPLRRSLDCHIWTLEVSDGFLIDVHKSLSEIGNAVANHS